MCGICSAYGHVIASAMYIMQRLLTCFALTAMTTCVIITILIMLGVGIGLGYHYCVVQTKTRLLSGGGNTGGSKAILRQNENADEAYKRLSGDEDMLAHDIVQPVKSVSESIKARDHKVQSESEPSTVTSKSTTSTSKSETTKNFMIVPLDGALDLSSLISKIRRLNKNITLEFIT